VEIDLLDHLVKDRDRKPLRRRMLSYYPAKIARPGGYLARARDPRSGNTVIWSRLPRFADVAVGTTVGAKFIGS
jgi:hypothetical protein